ncbi:hypothetical protein LBMAG56_28670 [Verrucomicrobiota bacterium]|nr:hypothetical protein LBMAG56_28670 [Verrucomicrobiota bacterium]
MLGTGCWPPGPSPQDEQKDPYFIVGSNRVRGRDFKGAIEAFTHSIENNPRSSAAHFELAILNEQHEKDFAAAIYHYQRFLTLQPNSDKAEIVKARMDGCKQEIAKSSLMLIAPPSQLREIENLKESLQKLTLERDDLKKQLAAAQARAGRDFVNPSNTPVVPPKPAPRPPGATPPTGSPTPGTTATSQTGTPKPTETAGRRTHTVKSGETPGSIAKQHGIPVTKLLDANPGLDPKRMRIGQTLNLPPASRP